MSWESCKDAIHAAAGRELSAQEKRMVAEKVKSIRERLDPGDPAAMSEALAKATEEAAIAQAIRRRNRALEFQVRRAEAQVRNTVYADDKALYLRALTRGTAADRLGAKDSLDANVWTQRDRRKALLFADLNKADAVAEMKAGAIDKDFFVYRWNRDHGGDTSKISPLARKVADIAEQHQENVRVTKNKFGAWIGKEPGYAARRAHDMWAIHKAGMARWIADMKQHFDMEKSFPGMKPEQIDKELAKDFHEFVTGKHDGFSAGGEAALNPSGIKERTYVAKSGEDEFAYFQKYGGGRTLFDLLMDEMDRGGRDIALMQRLGPNPKAMLQDIIDTGRRELLEAPGDNTKALKQFDKEANFALDRVWAVVAQDAGFKGSYVLARANMALINWVRAAASGNVLMASLGDPHMAANLRNFYTNRSTMKGLQDLGSSFKHAAATAAKGLGRDERHVMAMQHTAVEGMLHYVSGEGSPLSGAANFASGTAHAVYQIGRVQAWWNGIRFGSILATAQDFGAVVGRSFDALMPGQQAHLRHFGITPAEWDAIRRVPLDEYRGAPMLTAEGVAKADPELFRALHPKGETANAGQLKRLREDVAAKFGNLAHTTAEMSASTPTRVMAGAYITPGSQGTVGGAVMSHFRLFRSFADAIMGYHVARQMMGYHADRPKNLAELFMRAFTDKKAGQLGGVTGLMGGLVLAEWLRRNLIPSAPAAAGMAENRLPQTPEEAGQQVMEAFVGSGAFGFYGTLLEGIVGRFARGGDFGSTLTGLAGLSANHAANLYETGQDALELALAGPDTDTSKKARKLGRDAFKTVYELTPFRNMWFAKWATDYYIRDNINRWIDPEYMEQRELRRERAKH